MTLLVLAQSLLGFLFLFLLFVILLLQIFVTASLTSSGSSCAHHVQDSYALCRVFKKTIHIPKPKEEENNGNDREKDAALVSEVQLLGDDTVSGIESSKGRDNADYQDENFNNGYCKFPSETSSSDVTQGTPIETAMPDDLQPPFPSDEAISSASLYSMGVDFSSNLIQVLLLFMT